MKIIRADGYTEDIKGENDDGTLTLEQAQKAVGGYIELVHMPGEVMMIVDEEGICKNKEQNFAATMIAGQIIVGDVILCKETDLK